MLTWKSKTCLKTHGRRWSWLVARLWMWTTWTWTVDLTPNELLFLAATAAATNSIRICMVFATSIGCGGTVGNWHPVAGQPLGLESETTIAVAAAMLGECILWV